MFVSRFSDPFYLCKQNKTKWRKNRYEKNRKNFSVLQDSEELETSLFGGKEKDQNQNSEMLCKIITARSLFPNVSYFTLLSDFTFQVPADVLKLKETESEAMEKPDEDI